MNTTGDVSPVSFKEFFGDGGSVTESDSRTFHRRAILAAMIFFVVAGAIALTAHDAGLTWDEPIYYRFSIGYLKWFGNISQDSFQPEQILQTWGVQVHPPLGMLWTALFLHLFCDSLGLIMAIRLGAGILFGAAAAVLFLWVAHRREERTGIMAAAGFVLMPRLFAHGHFASLEMITLLFCLATTIAFENGIHRRGWSVVCGVLFGLALLTKINAVFLPIALVPWGILFHGRKSLRNILFMAALGPSIFILGWPAMWLDPLYGIRHYLMDKTSRMFIPTYYLGVIYKGRFAPWHYPIVMLLVTTPMLILFAGAAGIIRATKRLFVSWKDTAHEMLLIWSFLVPILIAMMPGVPKYDGIRLMLPAYPFLAALAACGAAASYMQLKAFFKCARHVRITGTAVLLWLVLPVVLFHPFQLSYYGELGGGPWGAQRLGFETTYWNDSFNHEATEFLNERLPNDGRVALVAVGDYIWEDYRRFGYLRKTIFETEFAKQDWDYMLVIPRQGMLDPQVVRFMDEHEAIWTRGLRPFNKPAVCLIYRKP